MVVFIQKKARYDELCKLYVTVDETGNLGKSSPNQREYIIGCCVVNDEDSFCDVAYRHSMRKGREIKFNTDPDLRETVLREASSYVDDIYYVRYKKDKILHNDAKGLTTEDRHDIHMGMMALLVSRMYKDHDGIFNVIVDRNSLVRDVEVIRAFTTSEIDSRYVSCYVADSKYNLGLQTNDFFIGALGHAVQGEYEGGEQLKIRYKYYDLMNRKPKEIKYH